MVIKKKEKGNRKSTIKINHCEIHVYTLKQNINTTQAKTKIKHTNNINACVIWHKTKI